MIDYPMNPTAIWHCQEPGCDFFAAVTQVDKHMGTHIPRPGPDYMTTREAAKAIGKPWQTVRSWVRFNGLETVNKKCGRVTHWIRRKTLAKFLSENFLNDAEKIVEWAETGKIPRG